ncbi:MAG: iron-containing alcohol dehydrogenase [Alicyclobacillus sp.]|nr:iron-containing alcohol dehydrogenase [Alicyclobacillus sp.]
MNAFDFQSRTRIAFGPGRVRDAAAQVARLAEGSRVLLVTDPGLVQTGIAARVQACLAQANLEVELFSDVQSDPSAVSIDAAADRIQASGARCVVGLGGGSAMDVAKMAAMVAGGEEGAEHYALMAHPFPPRRIRTVMIPTTAGTGAEVTSTVVFSNREKRKVWGWDEEMAADMAVLDPELTVGLPPHLTAATALDAMVHAIESMSGRRANPVIQAFSTEAIRLIARSLMRALKQPADLGARSDLLIAACLAGLGIEQGGTGIAHCIGHALGTLARVHHGRAVAIAMHAAIAWNAEAEPAVFADVARALGVIADPGQPEAELAQAGAERFRELVEATGLELSLGRDGLTLADAERFVESMESEENAPMRNNNCRASSHADLERFARHILSR